jgi:OOP family OmpA-OmpF porin
MTRIENFYPVALIVAVAFLGACATPPMPYKTPVSATPPTGNVGVSQTVTIFDASGSNEDEFPDGKATLESVVAVMPDGDYEAGQIQFGGSDREMTAMSAFSRADLAAAANGAEFLEGTSPFYSIFEEELDTAIGTGSGRVAVVVISDGRATDYAGRSGVEERTVMAARKVVEKRSGEVCFHTIQVGGSEEGGMLLRSISELTSCGSHRNASTLGTAGALQEFSRSVYLSPAPASPVQVAVVEGDADEDGVLDSEDQCPNTLKRAPVDFRGCWTLRDVTFSVNGAGIAENFSDSLREDIAVLKANPDVRIRIDGHTDSDGPAAYNQELSERRARVIRDQFIDQGLAASRFEVKGFGESNPIAPNDTPENKAKNRRVDLTIIE